MPEAARYGDRSLCLEDTHYNDCCPHYNVKGPAVSASGNVMINGRGALRQFDKGQHEEPFCCGSNEWQATRGSGTVFINGLPAVRKGDATSHCGGIGEIIEGSGNVLIGG